MEVNSVHRTANSQSGLSIFKLISSFIVRDTAKVLINPGVPGGS